MRIFAAGVVVGLWALALAGTAAGQHLEQWLEIDDFFYTYIYVKADSGWNAPSEFYLRIDFRKFAPPETTVFTSGNLKRESDEALSKVYRSFDTQWGKRYVFNEKTVRGRFEAAITFVESSSREIGVHMQIFRSAFEIWLYYDNGSRANRIEYWFLDPAKQSNTGTPGEFVFVLSRRNDMVFFGPPSPVPYASYYSVKDPMSPLEARIAPVVNDVKLRFSFNRDNTGIIGFLRGDEGGVSYQDLVLLEFDGHSRWREAPPGYTSRSSSREDMNYVKSLTSKISSSYAPAQATFFNLVEIDRYNRLDVDLQMIIAVDSSGRPAMILTIGSKRQAVFPWMVTYRYRRVFEGDADRGFDHETVIDLGRNFDVESNVGVPGIWVFVVEEDGTDLVREKLPDEVETPSLYKFCTEAEVDALIEADDITKKGYLNLEENLGWTGKWRKKSLGYLRRWDTGSVLSHYRASILKRGSPALTNYELTLTISDVVSQGGEMNLQRICVISDPGALDQIAQDTAAAGLDAIMSPELALVLEFEVVQHDNPNFFVEHVFASFPGRETMAVIANFPAKQPGVNLKFSTFTQTQCGLRDIEMTNGPSNTDVEGRYVIIYDGSPSYGSVQPSGADVFFRVDCDDYAAPCDGECPAGFSCQIHGQKTVCVNCGIFLRADDPAAVPSSCCALNGETNRCVNRTGRDDEICFVDTSDYFGVVDGREMVLPGKTQIVCGSTKNFKRNGGACFLLDEYNAKGNRKCSFPTGRFF